MQYGCCGQIQKKPIKIAGIGQATDTHAVAEREVPTDLFAVRHAAEMAYKMAGLTPKDIDVAELHDAFQILEIVESEEVGFSNVGKAIWLFAVVTRKLAVRFQLILPED